MYIQYFARQIFHSQYEKKSCHFLESVPDYLGLPGFAVGKKLDVGLGFLPLKGLKMLCTWETEEINLIYNFVHTIVFCQHVNFWDLHFFSWRFSTVLLFYRPESG